MIENQGFRELKQGWHISTFPLKKEKRVRAHAILTILMYALHAAYQSEQGQKAVRKGIRRMRMEDFQSIHKILVYSGDYSGIYDIEEYTVIIRSPPKGFVRADVAKTLKRLGLDD